MKIQNVKGGYDYLPKEQSLRNYINDTLRSIFEDFGYLPIETPILCYCDILSDKYDEENDILKEIYKLNDQGERRLGLRYDLTVPFAKLIALNKNKISFPFKRYEISKAFRDGPVKVGRDREFTQCDVDVVGITGQLIEIELLTLYKKAFDKLNIDIEIKYNSRNLMSGLIIESGINEDLVKEVTTILDKKEKISKEELITLLENLNINKNNINKLLDSFNLSLEELTIKYENTTNSKIKLGIIELNNLNNYIKKLNLEDTCIFTSTLARGQNYYTGNVFEVYDESKTITCSIGGGGRYDNMITEFINDKELYPAVGISFGLSSIYEILKTREEFSNNKNIDIYIIPINTEIETLNIANKIRDLDLKVEIDFQKRKLKKSLDYANKENIPYVIIIGEDEIKNNKFKLKNMNTKEEYEINMEKIERIKDILL